jgi:type II secretory pathway pseudopilin PulG
MTTAPYVPAPPQGPGVHPPFPAPPVEGKGKRVGWSIGIAIGVVVLVCGLGTAALIGVAVASQGAYQERAHAAVSSYLNAVRAGRYDQAYNLLCDDAQNNESPAQFRARVSAEPVIESYTMGDLDLLTGAVPVDATYDDGSSARLEAYLGVDSGTGTFEVCEIGE